MDQLLMLMEQELGQLRQAEMPNFDVLELSLDYFIQYPDACHHPKEDLIFKRLERRLPDISATLPDLAEEHRALAVLTQELASSLAKAREQKPGALEQLQDGLSSFLERYRAHMSFEEGRFFPKALEHLSDSDWAAVRFDLFDRVDPVFDMPAEGKFKRLRERIDWLAKTQRELIRDRALLVLSKEEARWLRSKATLVSFNRTLEEAGEHLRLIRQPGGGYALKRGSGLVIDIPECDEARAVWCAFFFLKGKEAGDAGG